MTKTMRVVTAALAAVAVATALDAPRAQAIYRVDNGRACVDGAGGGTDALPYCTLRYASTIAKPGDTFLVSSVRDGSGPAEFTKSGTAAAPITYRSTSGTVIGLFNDVRDEDFRPTATAHVYTMPLAGAWRMWQTRFDPIVVDDPNNSRFEMLDTDGPIALSSVTDDVTLAAREGTYRVVSGVLYVHPYGNRIPSTATTDFVVGGGPALNIHAKTQYNVFDGFTITYTGAVASFQVYGGNNRFLNLKIHGHPWSLRGSTNVAENIVISHVISRGKTWLWHESGDGTAMAVMGANHRITNIHIFHNWNSTIGAENAPGLVIDGLKAHGAPNHCSVVGSNVTLRNAVLFNCQDYFYLSDTTNVVIEHTVNPSGIALQGLTKPLGPVTVKNSILSGTFGVTSATKPGYCTWEKGSLIENSVVNAGATIQRCADMKKYSYAVYQAKCASGEFTDCLTIRNVRYFSNWSAVVTGGYWQSNTDEWDVTLAAGSPALDVGPSTTPTDITGRPRPQGESSDAGAYEACTCPAFVRRPGT